MPNGAIGNSRVKLIAWEAEESTMYLQVPVSTKSGTKAGILIDSATAAAFFLESFFLLTRTGMSEQWTVEDDYRLRSMKTGGSSWSEISSVMGRSVDSARGRWRNIQHFVGQQQVPAGELQRFSESAAKFSGKTVVSESPLNTKRLDVKHAWIDPDLDINEVWRKAYEDSLTRLSYFWEYSPHSL